MATLVDTKYLDMTLNGKPVSMLAKSSFARCFNLSYTTDEAVETHVMSFVLTVEGVQCAQPVTIGGLLLIILFGTILLKNLSIRMMKIQ